MIRKAVHSPRAPGAIGPYSQAIQMGPWLFCSGQIPLDPASQQIVAGGIEEQTRQVLVNLRNVLEEVGGSLQNLVKTTIFLKDFSHFQAMNHIYSSFVQPPYPARSTFAVADLPLGALVEIEAVAYLEEKSFSSK